MNNRRNALLIAQPGSRVDLLRQAVPVCSFNVS